MSRQHPAPSRFPKRLRSLAIGIPLTLALLLQVNGCPPQPPEAEIPFRNTTDPTNDGASYIGSAACNACHADIMERSRLHGHRFAMNEVQGAPPMFPEEAERAEIPDPPAGMAWTDISYVLSGYLKGAYFVNQQGFIETTGVTGEPTLYLLDLPLNGTIAGFRDFMPDQTNPLPLSFDCFRCHVTGPQPRTADRPLSQDGRVGIEGTWTEAGVGCEACHGPGSKHAPNPSLRNIYVSSEAEACGECHIFGDDPNVIVATQQGFVQGFAQYPELLASGGHSNFNCGFCHDPHASTIYEPEVGLRNECSACHADMNLAFHDGFEFEFNGFTLPLTCESCHMPPAGLITRAASEAEVGPLAKVGDVRSHIFRINTSDSDPAAFLADGGTRVAKDDQGRAALTVDFVCLRCHNVESSIFPLTLDGAVEIARDMHAKAAAAQRPIRPPSAE